MAALIPDERQVDLDSMNFYDHNQCCHLQAERAPLHLPEIPHGRLIGNANVLQSNMRLLTELPNRQQELLPFLFRAHTYTD